MFQVVLICIFTDIMWFLGHLAALYNYNMNRFADAEGLYLESIRIGNFY